MEINYGEYVDFNRMSGALVIDIDEDDWQLNIDDVNIQSSVSGYGGGYIKLQEHGGCIYMAHQVTTFANDLSTDKIYWYSTDSSRYQIQTGPSGQIAFGVVTDLGDKVSGSDNWSMRYNSIWDRYEITITNELYHLDDYTTTVTAIGGDRLLRVLVVLTDSY